MEAEIASLTDNKRNLVSEVDQSEAQERQDNSELRRIKNLLQEQKTSERALRRKIDVCVFIHMYVGCLVPS